MGWGWLTDDILGFDPPPPPPDYAGIAQQQADQQNQYLRDQTWANRANQYTPWGSQTWSAASMIDPSTGRPTTQWSQTMNLNPEAQAALDSQMRIQNQRSRMAEGFLGRMQTEFGQPVDWNSMTAWGTAPGGGEAQRQRAEDALYRSATSRLDPQWAERQRQMEVDLANSGITRGSSAYSRAMDDFNRGKTDAYAQAQNAAATGAGAEASRNYQMDLGNAQFQNQMRAQQMQEQTAQRGYSLNEMQALLNGQQVNQPTFGGYNQAGQGQAADLFGAAQATRGAQMQDYANNNAMMGDMMKAGAQLFAFSDEAVKIPLRRLAPHRRGFGIWVFRYIGESNPRIGVIAQEVAAHAPELVKKHPSGLLMVDYSKL